jgi:acyl dehydratase
MSFQRPQPGDEFGPSSWIDVDQARIDAFADATGDHQWIHVAPARAAGGPFGTTIAHGYLTLALLPLMVNEVVPRPETGMTVNYGLNRVRFPAPVPSRSRLRGSFRVEAVEEVEGGFQQVLAATVEREGSERPSAPPRSCTASTSDGARPAPGREPRPRRS